ncbi:MAG: hypothetical protein J5I65_14840 [Aridibacter famidurans]|nr:hypothetical protein [Aridibacter famidurans]
MPGYQGFTDVELNRLKGMKNGMREWAAIAAMAALVAVSNCTGAGSAVQEQESYLLTPEAAGPIKLGMSIGEARKAAEDWEFVRALNEDFPNPLVVEVRREGKTKLILKAFEGEYDPDATTHPIDEDGKIFLIVVLDGAFRTEGGVGVGTTVVDAEKVFGKLESMYNIPGRGETGRFSKLPEWGPYGPEAPGLNFIFASKTKDTAGTYVPVPDCEYDNPAQCSVAREYAADAFISKIVLNPKLEE